MVAQRPRRRGEEAAEARLGGMEVHGGDRHEGAGSSPARWHGRVRAQVEQRRRGVGAEARKEEVLLCDVGVQPDRKSVV